MALTRTNIVPAVSFPGNTNRMPFLLLWVWPIVFENRIDLPKSYPKSADSDSFFYEAVIYIFILKRRFIFLSIPLPGFVPSDRFAWNGPLRLSFNRRNSSQARQASPVGRSENLTGHSFLFQWFSATKPSIFRLHYRPKKGEGKYYKLEKQVEYGYLGYLTGFSYYLQNTDF